MANESRSAETLVKEAPVLHGRRILDAIQAAGVKVAVTLPDIWTEKALLQQIYGDKGFTRHIKVCKEDEGFGICSGLAFTDTRAMLFMQHTGLLDSLNAMRAVAVDFEQPICMVVGLLNKETDIPARQSKVYGVRIVEPVLDAMGIEHHMLDSDADVAVIGPAIDKAYAEGHAVVFLVGRSPIV